MSRVLLLLVAAALLPGAAPCVLAGQGTARALAAVPSDTITRLAVDPTKHQGRPLVTLLDETRLRVEPDGRTVTQVRQVVQVIDAQVVRGVAERSFGYAASHQSLRIDWLRVLKPSGEVLSDRAAQEQESDVPAAMSNPVYQEQKVRRVSLAAVAVGTIVDVAYTLEEKKPYRAGDFVYGWRVNNTLPVVRSLFVLDAPASYTPRIIEHNLNFRRTEAVQDGRRRYEWFAKDVPTFQPEPFAADSNNVVMAITVAAPAAWNDIASWYAGLARDRYAMTPVVQARTDSVVRAAGARTRLDTIRAVHRWVAQDIRYVSVALGIGGYQPRAPETTLSTGFGDCKDKATLFVAAMRRYGISANPVLLAIAGKPDRNVPSIHQFNHAIAAVRENDRAPWTYADLTAEFIPFGSLPTTYRGAFGIVVRDDGKAEEITFPELTASGNGSTMRIAFDIDSGGRLVGHVVEEPEGWVADNMRAGLGAPLDSARRAGLTRSLAQRTLATDATVDSLVAADGRNFAVAPRIAYRIVSDNALKTVGDGRLLPLSATLRGLARNYRNIARDLESRGMRRFPVDAGQILAPATNVVDLRITLPPGWTAELPKNVSATSFFGSYSSTWTQKGQDVQLIRKVQGGRGIFPPERIAEVIVWLKAVGADDYEFLSLRRAQVP